MPRRREVPKRLAMPDPKYHDRLVSKFISIMMYGGKKSTSEALFYRALDIIESRTKDSPLKTFKRALDTVKPAVEVKSRRVGGSTYQVPVDIRPERRMALAMRWLVSYSRNRNEKTMAERLANEFMDASSGRGNSVKKREDTHRMAEANKAFAHYRW